MLAMLIIMTLIVGMFLGASLLMFVFIKQDERERRALAKDRHPSNQMPKDDFHGIINATYNK